jgi:ketosteroid isomerase-like protein
MTTENLRTAKRLYRALAAQDRHALLETLAANFRGRVSEGMPNGLGGVYEGAEAMLRDCWTPLLAAVDVQPVPEEYLPVCDGRIVVLGRYQGTARSAGRQRLSAAFAHVLRFEDGCVSELVQVTDTACWQQALGPPSPTPT